MAFPPKLLAIFSSVLSNTATISHIPSSVRDRALNTAISQVGDHDSSNSADIASTSKAVIRRAIEILTLEFNTSISTTHELNAVQLTEMVNARKLQYVPAPVREPPSALSPLQPDALNDTDATALFETRLATRNESDIIEFESLDPPADTGKHVAWRAASVMDEITSIRAELAELRALVQGILNKNTELSNAQSA
jgi:hypothetical protein